MLPPRKVRFRGSWSRRSGRVALTALAAVIAVLGPLAVAVSFAAPAAADNWAPVHAGDFPDPSIMNYGGTYYAFATQNFASAAETINIQESTSTDGVNWTELGSDALPTSGGLGSWAKPGNTWAPTVVYNSNSNDFVMYYTATEAASPGDQCIGQAISTTPLGPYHDTLGQPIVCQDGIGRTAPSIDGSASLGGSIDPDLFHDSNSGAWWLLWKNDGNHVGSPTSIWSVPLQSGDLLPSSSSVNQLLTNSQSSWEGSVIEGPNMYETETTNPDSSITYTYYLFFSGNDEGASTYAIGWALCSNGPGQPCSDETLSGPLLSSQGQNGMSGPGGPEVFSLPPAEGQTTGQTMLAFAAWEGQTIGYIDCGIRPMYEADLTFASPGGAPQLTDPNPGGSAAASPTCPPPPPPPPPGYWQVASDGGVFTFGHANFFGSTGNIRLNQPVVSMAVTPDGNGYWLVASDGGIFAYGDAQFYGSTGNMVLNKPIVAMIPTYDGGGYLLIASDGGVFAFGDAKFFGSTGGDPPPYPITAAAPGFLDGGYWMVDGNGQVFNFGDAPAEGSPASAPDAYTISGIAPTHDDHGYWLSSWNGNVADFGDAADYGSMYGTALNSPVIGITTTPDGDGYWLQGKDGGIFTFGDAPFLGSMGGQPLNAPMVGIAAR